uniref:Uncharacterized protein n=1 Tax=Strigamia maritima TaxID=126957 RepID=T1IR84_STRMM
MAVYFENRVETGSTSAIHTNLCWHKLHPLLAIASYAEDLGGYVSLYNEEGQKLEADILSQSTSQVTCLVWHPLNKHLIIAWESGDIVVWNQEKKTCIQPDDMHKAPIVLIEFSAQGSRFISADTSGSVMCWNIDRNGQLSVIFHHELKDVLVQVSFRTVTQPLKSVDIAGLARAAVAGDEIALDLFSSWNLPSSKSKKLTITGGERKENLEYFAASTSGIIYYVNTNGSTTDVCQLDVGIKKLMFHEDRDLMVVITENLILYQFQVSPDGDLEEVSKVKLIGKTSEVITEWAGPGILAVSTGENLIRIWDIDMTDNYVLMLEGSHFTDSQEVITSISFSTHKNTLCAGTSRGTVVLWKYLGDGSPTWRKESEKAWQLQSPTTVQAAIKHVAFGSDRSYLAVNTVREVYILSEQVLCAHYRDGLSAVQTSPTQLSIDLFATDQRINFRADIQVRGVYVTMDHLAVWDGKKVAVYEISTDSAKMIAVGSFGVATRLIAMYENNVYTGEESKIYVRTYQGTIKQTLAFMEDEGNTTCMQINGTFLLVGTSLGLIKMWDISRREAKLHVNPKSFSSIIPDLNSIICASCNSTGTKISLSVTQQKNNSIDPKLYIWIPETDTVQYFDFSLGISDIDDESGLLLAKDGDLTALERNRLEIAKDIKGRFPIGHFWDPEESRQLVCQASKPFPGNEFIQLPFANEYWQSMTVSILVTSEAGILIQEATSFENSKTKLLGINIPHYYLLCRPDTSIESSDTKTIEKTPKSKLSGLVAQFSLRDFMGLEDADKKTRQAMIDFSYFLTVGNLDEAFKAIKAIKSGSVWENMAKMCVKTKRLDVASVCLGNMGHARGAKALREAANEPELDARVAYLALHLGMVDAAEKLLSSCKRYDLLNRVYQDSGQWTKALEVANKHDRIHSRCTYYNYAKYLEAAGDIGGAIPNYEKSDTHRFEVPRMLFEEPHGLEEYISRNKDKSLQRWWAQYMESTGEMEIALQYYEQAQDYLSLVRVYCYCNNLEKAAEIANDTGDKAACYHLGRQYENHDDIKEAVHFYTRAQAYSNAVRLCKEHGLEDQLLNLGLMGNSEEMLDVAKFYENKPGHEANAIMLYHKAGLVGRAVELAFQTNQYSVLHQIASELTEKTDPQLVHRVAQFFVNNSQFDRAVDLLAVAKRYVEALDLCVEHNISINEELAEKLTPVKGEADEELRMRVLEKVADSCYQQENYQLATKKYTQAGNKIKAMKALLKSGNTEKIVFFANVSRQKEIYIMAANYLQSLDWREQPEVMKHIIQFYTKGRALDLLGGFYEACAQAEIDEYQNYEKALGALNEANKCFTKISDRTPSQEDRMLQLTSKLELVKKFVHVRRVYETNPEESMKFCQSLLSEPHLDAGVRRGDILGFMIEHYARQNNYKTAYNLIEEMRTKLSNVNLAYYVNVQTIETIFARLDLPLNRASLGLNKDITTRNAAGDEGDEIEEQVNEKNDNIFSAGDVFAH